MQKSQPSAPKPPDPFATAQAQGAANADTARLIAELNRVNQYTPDGSIVYSKVAGQTPTTPPPAPPVTYDKKGRPIPPGGTKGGKGGYVTSYTPQATGQDQWEARVTLSPDQQRIHDLQAQGKIKYGEIGNTALDNLRGKVGTELDLSGLPQINDGVMDRKRVEDALFARINPQLENQRNSLDTRLRNQGLTPGSEAWTNAMREYGMSENDARLGVVNAGGAEQARLYGMSADARQKALQEMLTSRAVPLNEVQAMLGGTQVSYPQFNAVPQTTAQPVDIAGINQNAFNNQMGLYNSGLQQQAGMMSGLAQLGGSALSAFARSDERSKENIKKVGKTDNDLAVYLFNYKGDPEPRMSVMAQDVEKVNPGAVVERPDGMKMVNLEQALMATRGRKKAA